MIFPYANFDQGLRNIESKYYTVKELNSRLYVFAIYSFCKPDHVNKGKMRTTENRQTPLDENDGADSKYKVAIPRHLGLVDCIWHLVSIFLTSLKMSKLPDQQHRNSGINNCFN